MKITFGIITNGSSDPWLHQIVDSIENTGISKKDYEIVLVGGQDIHRRNLQHIAFDESKKSNWITKKKNLIIDSAANDTLVLLHDYITFDINWYYEFVSFCTQYPQWDVCMNQILNLDGTRYRDWVGWPPKWIDYNDWSQTQNMYVSGAYWIATRAFMRQNKLDETRVWGYSEDLEWSVRVRNKWRYVCADKCKVRLLKQKEHAIPQ